MEDMVEWIRWAAAILTIVAALMVAWGAPARLVAWGFVVFTVASVLWIVGASVENKWALIAQNAVLFGVNVWGVWRWWRRIEAESHGGPKASAAAEPAE